MADSGEPVDLASEFPICSCKQRTCLTCRRGWQLSPRMAAALRWAASITADDAYDDIEQHGGEPVCEQATDWSLFDTYPRSTWQETAEWRRQAARAYDDLADDIDHGLWPLPRCAAERLALRTLLLRLRDWTCDRDAFPTLQAELEPLPQHPDDDNWNGAAVHLLQDHDGPNLDDLVPDPGRGDAGGPAWFKPFHSAHQRDPNRGFRR